MFDIRRSRIRKNLENRGRGVRAVSGVGACAGKCAGSQSLALGVVCSDN